MYVRLGFSLACLRRARSIDPQCQSFSLRGGFLLCSVCYIRWPARSRNQSKVTAKIIRKSMPGEALGHPKSTQNRSRDPLGTHLGVQERPEGVSGASWGTSRSIPGVLRECPEGRQGCPGTPESGPWSAWERAEATKIDAKSRPGAEKSSFLRAARLQSIVGAIFRRFWSICGFSAKSAIP